MAKEKKKQLSDIWNDPYILSATSLIFGIILLLIIVGVYGQIGQIQNSLREAEAKLKSSDERLSALKEEIIQVQATLHEQLNLVETEVFRAEDLNDRVMIWPKPLGPSPDSTNYVLIELDKIPFENTVAVVSQSSALPPDAFDLYGNVVMISTSDPVESILHDSNQFIAVTYIPYKLAHQKLYTIQGARIISVVGNRINFVFNFRE